MKKRSIAALIIIMMVIMNVATVFAGVKEETPLKAVTIGVYSKEGFAQKNENGDYEGYVIEYLTQLGIECGYKVDVLLVDRGMLFENLILQKCDLVLTEEKFAGQADYVYSHNGLIEEYDVLYVNEEADVYFDEYDKFDNMTIGLCRNSLCEGDFEEYAAENGFTYKKKYFEDENRLLLAVEQGEVDAALVGNLTYVDEKVRNVAVFGQHEYILAGGQNMQQVIDDFDSVVTRYKAESNSYIRNLYDTLYWQSKANYISLTRAEHEYVRRHHIIKVGYFSDSYPMQYTNDLGEFDGIARQFFDYFSDYTGFEFQYYEYDDSELCLQDLINKNIELIAMVPYYRDTLEKYSLKASNWYLQVPLYEVKLSEHTRTNRIALPSLFAAAGLSCLKDFEYSNYNSVAACLDAVKNGEADSAFINGYSWMLYSEKPSYSMLTAENMGEYVFMSAVSYEEKGETSITGIVNKAINAVSPELSKNRTINGAVFSDEKSNQAFNFIVKYRLYICLLVVICLVVVISILISVKKKKSDMLERLAYTDMVTGGWNQSRFYMEADKIKCSEGKYAVGYINIVNFKYINDFYGREQGDNVLKVMSHMLDDMMQPDGMYARVSADRFVFLTSYIDYETLKYNYENYISNIEINISGFADSVIVKSTCGIYLAGKEAESVRDMVDKAAIAEKRARDDLRVPIVLYDDTLNAEFVKNQEMTSSMKKALENNEFVVYLQPKVDINSELPVGCEALVRWISPEKGFISPGDFIPLFEKNGFVTEVDFFVLEKVCRMLRRRMDNGLPVFPVNLNQSRLHVNDRMYLSMLQDMLNKYDIPMNLVVFEITESAFIEDSHAMIGLINKMKSLGFKFSMDDFGSGYSSFNLLKDMPVDELKIDKEFLESTDNSTKSRYIIEKIVQMAHGLDIRVVCEGVEREEQVEFLREIECDIIQGYYYSKPMPMDEYEKYLLQFDLRNKKEF